MSEVIVAQNLGKQYARYHPERPTTLVEAIARGVQWLRPSEKYWALREANFAVGAGRMVGIIGANGAGKSTLLRLIGGVSRPDEGLIRVRGRIGALLDLGTGFHPDLTGRENVFVNGIIAGLTRSEVAKRFDDIVAFAELAEWIDDPLRTYSTGMQMRLSFAVATHIEPEILLIDEVLAVGDLAFQRKCLERIRQFKTQACTVVLVTHDPTLVSRLCDEVLWLKEGRVVAHDAAEVVIDQYVAEMNGEISPRQPVVSPLHRMPSQVELKINENRFGSQEMRITKVRLLDGLGQQVRQLTSGEPLLVEISYDAPQPIDAPIFGATLVREDDLICYESSTQATGLFLATLQGAGQITLQIDRLDLMEGLYYVNVGIYEQNWTYAYDYHWHIYPLSLRSSVTGKGVLQPPHYWQLTDLQL